MVRQIRSKEGSVEYELKRTDRKSVECRVNAEGAVVFAPIRMPLKDVDEFVRQRVGWILEASGRLQAQAERAKARLEQNLSDGAAIPLEGRIYALRLSPGAKKGVSLRGNEIIVTGTEDAEEIRALLRRYLSSLAGKRIYERVMHFGKIIGKIPNRVAIREQKTKWGSCSGKDNLNFNWKLIMARPEALDYVVVHELCHMVHLNHSPDFWKLVEKYMPDYKKWQDYLKKEFTAPL